MPEVDLQTGAAGSKLSPEGTQQNVLAAGGPPAHSTPTSSTKAPPHQAATPRLIQPGPGYRIAQHAHALVPRQPLQVTSTAPIVAAHPAHPNAPGPNALVSAPAPPASASQPPLGSAGLTSASAIQVAASSISPGPSLGDTFSTLLAMLVPQPLDASAYPITLGITLNGTRAVAWTVPRAGSRPTMHSFIIPPQMQAAMHDPRTQSHISWAALNELWRTAEARAVAQARRADSKGSQLAAAHQAATDARADVRQLQCRVSALQAHIACAEQRAGGVEERASDAEKRADIANQRVADVDQRAGDAAKTIDALKEEIASAEAKAQERRDYALHVERVARAAQACVVELEARQQEREAHAREVSARENIVVERESQLLARETTLRAREIALENQEGSLVAREVEMKARPERVLELEGMVHDLGERIRVLQEREAELEQKVHELEARPRKKVKTKRH